jgi:hypothetical protein
MPRSLYSELKLLEALEELEEAVGIEFLTHVVAQIAVVNAVASYLTAAASDVATAALIAALIAAVLLAIPALYVLL